MTVEAIQTRISYLGDGSTTDFAIPASMWILDDDDITVWLVDADDVGMETAAFTVLNAGNPNGSTLRMNVAPASGYTLLIIRDPVEKNTADYIENDAFPSDRLEQQVDRLTMIAQFLRDEVSRKIGFAQYTDLTGFDTMLPPLEGGMLLQLLPDLSGFGFFDPNQINVVTTYNPASLPNVAALRLVVGGTDGDLAQTAGYYTKGDGGAGQYYWDASSVATDNGGTVIKPTAIGGGSPGRWMLNVGETIYAAQFGIKDDGDGVGGGTDNLNALLALVAWLATRERAELIFPKTGGIICWTNHIFVIHCGHLVVKTNGCRFQNITQGVNAGFNMWWGSDYFTDQTPGVPGFTGTLQMPFFIDSVEAGDTQATLQTLADVSNFSAGQRAMLMGYDQQGYGYPPNFRYFEQVIVRDVDVGTGVITFDRPLRNAYRSDWPAYFDAGLAGGTTIGPAGILPIDRPMRHGQRYLEIDRLEYLKNPYDVTPFSTVNGEPQYGSRSPYFQGWDRLKIGELLLDQFAVGQGGVYEIDYLKCIDLQGDKLLGALLVHAGHITKATDGTGIGYTYFGPKVEFKYNLTITGPHVEVDGSLFTNPDSSTGNRPIGTAFFNSAESFKINGARFVYADQTGVIAGGNFQEDVTDPDRPGFYLVTATAVAAGQFTVAYGDGSARLTLRKGTKLTRPSDKAVFTVKDIRSDGTDFVVLYTGTGTISVSDKLWYYPLQVLEVGGGNIRIGDHADFPLCDDKIVAQHYTDVDGGMTAETVNKSLQINALKINGTVNKIYLDGYIQEIEVNIIKAYSGAGSGNLVVSVIAPNGDAYTSTINTKNTGRRRILAASSVNNKAGDTLNDLGYDKYIMGAGVTISASDNTGNIGCKGTIRFIGVRR